MTTETTGEKIPEAVRERYAEDCGQQLPRYARRTREVSRHSPGRAVFLPSTLEHGASG